jgi:hypothetical protein
MKKIGTLFTALGLFISLASFTTPADPDCAIMHSGTFVYDVEGGGQATVVIKGNKHTEYHSGGKYVIESTLEWTSECEYRATLIKATLPDFPFKKGTTLTLHINRVEGKTIYFTCTILDQGEGMQFDAKLTKVKE